MDTLLRIGFYILAFNAVLLVVVLLCYLVIGRHRNRAHEFEEYLTYLFSHKKVRDPWILIDDKWVKNE